MNLAPQTGADDRIRTGDPLITNEMLYQLSYIGWINLQDIKDFMLFAMVKILNFPETQSDLFELSA